MNLLLRVAMVAALAVFVTGCARDIGAGSYSAQSVGEISRVQKGVVVSARPVTVRQSEQGLGTGIGAVGGGIAGSYIGGDTRANLLGGLAGAVIGGLAGTAADRALTTQGGMEYVVQLDGGQAVTLVQGPDTQIPVGQRVLVLYGERARIVPDQSAGAGYW